MTTPNNPPPGEEPPQWSAPPPPPGPGPAPAYQQPYGEPPKARSGAQVLSIIGFVCAAIALVFIPILFGIAGIVLGVVGHTRGEPLGKWTAVTSGVTMILGMVIGYLLAASMMS
ncbi:hypothetical protein OIE66_15830 [Nonomuraea sp. NBC_01738]|uniref:hypothetical protein n=1 Tax=Nonomuraea sp. NBC_01738 TaxID=2976003 RepID=UPI002E0E15CF|nr:hypothetical protein OIE66_15830 [Nonomuraea sp. NBC_01738]